VGTDASREAGIGVGDRSGVRHHLLGDRVASPKDDVGRSRPPSPRRRRGRGSWAGELHPAVATPMALGVGCKAAAGAVPMLEVGETAERRRAAHRHGRSVRPNPYAADAGGVFGRAPGATQRADRSATPTPRTFPTAYGVRRPPRTPESGWGGAVGRLTDMSPMSAILRASAHYVNGSTPVRLESAHVRYRFRGDAGTKVARRRR